MEDWQKDIHDRMEHFEADAPQGLWEAICSAESNAAAPAMGAGKGGSRRLWSWGAAVAACLLLFGMVQPILNGPETTPAGMAQVRPVYKNKVLTGRGLPTQEPVCQAAGNALLAMGNTCPAGMEEFPLRDADAFGQPSGEAANEQTSAPSQSSGAPAASPAARGLQSDLPKDPGGEVDRSEKRKKGRFEIALTTATGNGGKARRLYNGGAVSASSVLGDSEWADSPLLGIMTMNRGAETERKITYHMPVRTGFSVCYRINDRWGIETGLSYAFVGSDIFEGTAANYVEEKQKLHYLGIPLGVSFRLASWRRLDVYLTGNVMAEQCVYAGSAKRFYIAGKLQGEEANALSPRPLQWSVGAKAGLQYNFSERFSVYAEPGCIYYFDDRSPLETVFKKRPFDFSLNLGLRCSLGKKKV